MHRSGAGETGHEFLRSPPPAGPCGGLLMCDHISVTVSSARGPTHPLLTSCAPQPNLGMRLFAALVLTLATGLGASPAAALDNGTASPQVKFHPYAGPKDGVTLIGLQAGGLDVYKGIPYAAPRESPLP